jgi:hypothetical protein
MNLSEEAIHSLKNTPKILLKDIAEAENINISNENLENIGEIKSNLKDIRKAGVDESLFVNLMSKLDSKTLADFIIDIDRLDEDFLKEIIKITNDLSKRDSKEASDLIDKLLTIYRMNVLSVMFSENRLASLELALKNYK